MPQLNLYYTEWANESKSDSINLLQHNCFRTGFDTDYNYFNREIISYCMSELPSKFNIDNNDIFPKFTFDELSKQDITSQQLYLWSAPIDIIEHYQFYLNQLSISNDILLAQQVFYNCTLPRFGPMCQYELYYDLSHHSSLSQLIHIFYSQHTIVTTNLTCYMHLKCNRGPSPSCLDWTEICDGKFDCLDDDYDEEHCWQLEINQCKDNEYRCINGQCIPKSSFREEFNQLNCLDASDRTPIFPDVPKYACYTDIPSFVCDDVKCDHTHITSSCLSSRSELLLNMMYSIKDNSVSEDCWSALKCIFNIPDSEPSFCEQDTCIQIIKNNCPDMFYFPNVPVFFHHVYFAFRKTSSQYLTSEDIGLLYICYNNSRYDTFFNMSSKLLFNNSTCFIHETISYQTSWSDLWIDKPRTPLKKLYSDLKKYQFTFNYTSTFCNRSNMYQCIYSSKCISIHRLMDNIYDCPHMDDEIYNFTNDPNMIELLKQTHYKCQTSNKYIHRTLTENGICDCENTDFSECEDENRNSFSIRKEISFQTICDGFTELTPVVINGQNETDETECEQWECNNIYTHCDRLWNCPNGMDEINCHPSLPFNCPLNHHICVSPYTNQLMCLPTDKANDGNIDCLGAHDEPILCRSKMTTQLDGNNFQCMNQSCITNELLCNGHKDCEHGDDEQFCTTNKTLSINYRVCWSGSYSNVEKIICDRSYLPQKEEIVRFSLANSVTLVGKLTKTIKNSTYPSSPTIPLHKKYENPCHRGLEVHVWLNKTTTTTTTYTCFCPPSFYGDRCQYQNQRISLTLEFRALSDSWQTLFTIVVSLIDDSDQQIIHSYEQLSFLSLRDCKKRISIYLIYSTQPKDPTKNYSIHLDIYEKMSLNYRGSLLFPINFPFLPVHRLTYIVDIPRNNDRTLRCSNNKCIHGQCFRYSNSLHNQTHCKCNQGWTGRYCTIPQRCTCAFDSLCIGISANNQSICVCPIDKFGSRCLLTDTICHTNNVTMCKNGGQCISNNDLIVFQHKFMCICREGFSGDQCEIDDKKLILSFDKKISLSQSIFVHFIDLTEYDKLKRTTTFRTIPVRQDSVIIYWSQPFHLLFIELSNKDYYSTIIQKNDNQSTTMIERIKPSDRCPNIRELFNETFLQWHLLRRIKYYHLPCQQQSSNLSCFHDEAHLCLCYNFGQKRLANCFNFDHNMTFNCLGQSECENGAQCFQDSPTCPTRSMCMCLPCFYGRRCQFSTSGFGVTLDAILGYHILQDVHLTRQSSIVQFSAAFTIIFVLAGLINAFICIITFKNKSVCEVGCGLYLLVSSIAVLFTIIMFGMKFLILLLAQMTFISNSSFLLFQCRSIDFLLRIFLNIDKWLNACVAIERAVTTIKSTSFDKKKSKKAAKFVIVILLIVVIGTNIHDPIYRRLVTEVNDANEMRIWCVTNYSSNLQLYNSIMNTIHFFGPFIINFLSAIILIAKKSCQKATVHPQRPYNEHLREQIEQHKRLLIAPIALVILALPRLIITFVSACMKSTDDSWLFLIGYFISFIPSLFTFVIFIIPSDLYRKETKKKIIQYRVIIQRRLQFILS